jgi:glutamyl-tRNA synthetase
MNPDRGAAKTHNTNGEASNGVNVVTRIAPSPTGYLHFGLARTALFNCLYARKNGGTYITRIEDTDTARNKSEYETDIIDQLAWLGLESDATYRQSEHRGRHEECLNMLISSDRAYISREPAKDDPSRAVEVIRLRNRGEIVAFNDLIRGEISFDTTELRDFVIARSRSQPLYHLAVVIDDHDEGVTHVIRGEDHISNTPRQILIQRALGFEVPTYAHLPLILMPDKSKMSKRKHESSVKHFREEGILPEALINYVALLGWSPGNDRELFSLKELIDAFDITRVQKSGATFDMEKLRWYNRQYLLAMRQDDFGDECLRVLEYAVTERRIAFDENIAHALVPLIKERISTWHDLQYQVAAGEYDYFFKDPELNTSRLPEKKSSPSDAQIHLKKTAGIFAQLASFDVESIGNAILPYANEAGRGAVLWPLRYALTGCEKSPDPFVVASIIGKDAVLRRISHAHALLNIHE